MRDIVIIYYGSGNLRSVKSGNQGLKMLKNFAEMY